MSRFLLELALKRYIRRGGWYVRLYAAHGRRDDLDKALAYYSEAERVATALGP